MNYESFMKLPRVDLQLRKRGLLETCHRGWPESRLASDCSQEICFVDSFDFVLLRTAEQIVVMSLRGDVAALDESLYSSSITVLQSIA